MSLRIWLPLNGDLRNQGLNDVTVTSGNPNFKNIGKISSQSIDLSKRVVFNCPSLSGLTSFSIVFWAKVNSDSNLSANWVDVLSFVDEKSDKSDTGVLRWETCYAGTNYTNWGISSHDNSAYNISSLASFQAVNKNTWHHIAMTVDLENNMVKEYHNGILKVTSTCNGGHLTGVFHIGGNNAINGEMNDLRIYSNALSPLEVKRLSQGLCLHYRLSGVGGENLAKASTLTTQMGSSPELKTLTFSGWDNYCEQVLDLTSTEWNALVGTKITYRMWLENVEQTVGTGTGIMLHFRYADGTYQQFGGGKNGVERSYLTQGESGWVWLTVTVPDPTTRSNPTTIDYVQYSIRHNSNTGESTVKYQYAKVEKGSVATPWCPNSTDELYSTMGLDDGIEYDCSGFGNNGTKIGGISWSSDTPRYSGSYEFDGGNTCITFPYDYTALQTNFTMNIWFKKNELGSKNYETLIGGTGGFEMDTRSGASTTLSLYMASTRGGSVYAPFNMGEWYMVTLVNDGTNELYYVNGQLQKTIEKKPMPSSSTYYIGSWRGVDSQNYKGLMSDFRIYATALSADDILSLYNLGGSLDSNGTFHTYEYVEV